MIEYLKWDSDFFGYKIGRINIAKPLEFSLLNEALKQQTDYRLIYLVIDEKYNTLNLQRELKEVDIKLVDEKVTFQRVVSFKDYNNSFENIELYSPIITTPKLIDLSLQSGIYSRFLLDDNFINDEYRKLYTTWIENSVNGEIADKVIVAYEETEIIGVLTLSFKENYSDIGILAVDSNYRGRKIGKRLVERAIFETKRKYFNEIKVVTQNKNVVACHFYKQQDFKIEQLEYIYHIWL